MQGESFFADFKSGYQALNISPVNLSFVDNFRSVKTEKEISRQTEFFQKFSRRIKTIERKNLSAKRQIDLDLIEYEIRLNSERLELETTFVKNKPENLAVRSILEIPNGDKWYRYLLKRWVDRSVTPDLMFAFGLAEIEKVQAKITDIQRRSKLTETEFEKHLEDSQFFYNDVRPIQDSFDATKQRISKNLTDKFPFLDKIPGFQIRRSTNPNMQQVPGFYSNRVFYYNYFDKPFKKRQIEWIYIHEAMPGHHFQTSVENFLPLSETKRLFRYSGFMEGWAAYVEDIGWEYDAYPDLYSELGKWEWDLVRSVRISLDVGLNSYGWSDRKALEFWKKNISNQDDIAMREINRMRRWPAQVITYKYGANRFLEFKQKAEKKEGKNFNLKDFHRRMLENGSLPFSVLEKHL
jgi:uncharacterized protein (DUF885 family)